MADSETSEKRDAKKKEEKEKKKKKKGSLALALMAVVCAMWAGTCVIYHSGGEGVSFGSGSGTSFEREFDRVLFKIDDGLAYEVGGSGTISLVAYEGGVIPLRPLCGSYWSDGAIIPTVHFRKGPWVYSEYPQYTKVDAYNLETAEQIAVEVQPAEGQSVVDPAAIPEYAAHGLTFAEEHRLELSDLMSDHEELSTINDSCITFNAAFIFLVVVLAIAWGLGLLLRRIRGRTR